MDNSENILAGVDVVRAWKDQEYRDSLSPAHREALPPAPTNLDELSDDELSEVAGGTIVATVLCPIVLA